jgi:hypothetical protein
MVDDVLFILRKCGVRALATGNVQVGEQVWRSKMT